MKIICKNCKEEFESKDKKRKFCSQSCSASFNNKGVRRHGEGPGSCLSCGERLKRSQKKYCNNDCKNEKRRKEWIEEWLGGKHREEKDGYYNVSKHIRRWVKEKQEGKCAICGISEWCDKPVPLVLDHIDGDASNSAPENFRMVCRNCDGQLDTFCGRNKGNGRRGFVIAYKK